jgi:hypothetical protein
MKQCWIPNTKDAACINTLSRQKKRKLCFFLYPTLAGGHLHSIINLGTLAQTAQTTQRTFEHI